MVICMGKGIEHIKLEEFGLLFSMIRDFLHPSYCKAFSMLDELSDIMKMIDQYVKKHGNIALACGSEWMFQDDEGRVDALELAGNILDRLKNYAEPEEETEED